MHYLRHKNILKTVRKLAEIDEDVANHLIGKITLQAPNTEDSSLTLATNHEDDATPLTLKQAEWKKGRKSGAPDTPSKLQDVEAFSKRDTDFISTAIHLEVHEGKGAWKGQNAVDAYSIKDEPKEIGTDSEAEVEARAKGFGTPPNSRRLRRVKKIAAVIKGRHIYGSSKMDSLKRVALNDPYDGLDPEILERLGIKVVSPHKNSPIRRELVRKLLAQIKEDVGIQTQEKAEAQIRAEGFWNWAGKSAYQIIMNNRENLDWATGVRISTPNEKSSNQGRIFQLPEETTEAIVANEANQTDQANHAKEYAFDGHTVGDDDDAAISPFLNHSLIEVNPAATAQANSALHEADTELEDKSTMMGGRERIVTARVQANDQMDPAKEAIHTSA